MSSGSYELKRVSPWQRLKGEGSCRRASPGRLLVLLPPSLAPPLAAGSACPVPGVPAFCDLDNRWRGEAESLNGQSEHGRRAPVRQADLQSSVTDRSWSG